MHEWDEVATNLLPHYVGWLAQGIDRRNTMETARAYVRRDPLLAEESAQLVDNIASALFRMVGRGQ